MEIQLKASKIWLASEAVDFRKAVDGLHELVVQQFKGRLEKSIYVFYNRARNKLKLLSYHRNGAMLIYKRLDKKKFTLKRNALSHYEINEKQLAWLLAGLDWVAMSDGEGFLFEDYF